MTQPFFVAFAGPPDRFPILERVFNHIRSIKPQCVDLDFDARGAVIDDPAWLDLLDDASVINALTSPDAWALEDILDSMLTGEHTLLSVTFSDAGRLEYDPHSFPFGGTDPIGALTETFGFSVTHDSCYDS